MDKPDCAGELLLELTPERGNGLHIVIYKCAHDPIVLHICAEDIEHNRLSFEYDDRSSQSIEQVVAMIAAAIRKQFEELAWHQLQADRAIWGNRHVN